MMIPINYIAVLAAAIAAMVVGFVWYSPILFAVMPGVNTTLPPGG